jgi:hypothetical protein
MSTLIRGELAQMFFGRPLSQQMADTDLDQPHCILHEHLQALHTHIANFYPLDDRELSAALADIQAVTLLSNDGPGLAAKRALLMFGIFMEDAVALGMANGANEHDCLCAEDLILRVLPVVVPELVRTMGQFPHSIARAAAVLHVMWPDEDLSVLEAP